MPFVFFIYLFKKVYRYSFVWGGVVSSVFVNTLLLVWFYPNLLQYQSQSKVGQKICELKIQDKSFGYHEFGFTTDFYSKSYIPQLINTQQIDSVLKYQPFVYLYTNTDWLKDLQKYKIETSIYAFRICFGFLSNLYCFTFFYIYFKIAIIERKFQSFSTLVNFENYLHP